MEQRTKKDAYIELASRLFLRLGEAKESGDSDMVSHYSVRLNRALRKLNNM